MSQVKEEALSQDEQDYKELQLLAVELHKSRAFQKVIVDLYLKKTALSIGSTFTGSSDDIDALKAVTHLNNFMTSLTGQELI